MDKLWKIRQLRWKECLYNIKMARFESDLLKTNEDIAPRQSREISQMFVWWKENHPPKSCKFSELCGAKTNLFPLTTYHFQPWQFYQFKGVLSSSVNRFSLTVSCQKLKKTDLLNSDWAVP